MNDFFHAVVDVCPMDISIVVLRPSSLVQIEWMLYRSSTVNTRRSSLLTRARDKHIFSFPSFRAFFSINLFLLLFLRRLLFPIVSVRAFFLSGKMTATTSLQSRETERERESNHWVDLVLLNACGHTIELRLADVSWKTRDSSTRDEKKISWQQHRYISD